MITQVTSEGQTSVFYGLSTDTKPDNVPNASEFMEMDTSDKYVFDAQGQQWLKWTGGSSGGGGDSGGGSGSGGTALIELSLVDGLPQANKTWKEIFQLLSDGILPIAHEGFLETQPTIGFFVKADASNFSVTYKAAGGESTYTLYANDENDYPRVG